MMWRVKRSDIHVTTKVYHFPADDLALGTQAKAFDMSKPEIDIRARVAHDLEKSLTNYQWATSTCVFCIGPATQQLWMPTHCSLGWPASKPMPPWRPSSSPGGPELSACRTLPRSTWSSCSRTAP